MSGASDSLHRHHDVTGLEAEGSATAVADSIADDYISVARPPTEHATETAVHLKKAMSLPSQQQYTRTASRAEDPNLTEPDGIAGTDIHRQVLLSDVSNLIKQQDRVIAYRVQAKTKREEARQFRETLIQECTKIARLLEDIPQNGPLNNTARLPELRESIKYAQNTLGPAEEELSTLELRLINEEAKLKTIGDQIEERWGAALPEPTHPLKIPLEDDDDALTEFAFASSSSEAELTPVLAGQTQGFEETSRPLLALLPPPFAPASHRAGAGPSSLLATQGTLRRLPDDSISVRHEQLSSSRQELDESIRHSAPDLDANMKDIADAERPDLYVDIERDLPELADVETNVTEHMESRVTKHLPKEVSSTLYWDFTKLAGLNQALKRWTMHHLRKSVLDMVAEYSNSFDENRMGAIISMKELDQGEWIDITLENPRPKRTFIIWM